MCQWVTYSFLRPPNVILGIVDPIKNRKNVRKLDAGPQGADPIRGIDYGDRAAGLANAAVEADHFSAAGGVAVGHAGNVEDESRDAGFDMLPDLIAERKQRRVKDHPSRQLQGRDTVLCLGSNLHAGHVISIPMRSQWRWSVVSTTARPAT